MGSNQLTAAEVTEKVFRLYRAHGDEDYLGECVTQQEHAIQCAVLAQQEDGDTEVILGALLHDIGHLCGLEAGKERMVTGDIELGVQGHDKVGEAYLKNLGVPSSVTDFVLGHVSAKRYLTHKDKAYHDQLSEASKMTLVHQGGPMSAAEAAEFEKHPRKEAILKMRSWDEKAKVKGLKTPPLSHYEAMFREYMAHVLKK